MTNENERNDEPGVEQEGEDQAFDQPWDPGLIRVDPKSFSLKNILDMLDDGSLKLDPEFQRRRVWDQKQKVRLIESILLRTPLPAFYFDADESGYMQVVDGMQRLSSVQEFVQDRLRLDGLEYLGDRVGGKLFSGLEKEPIWRRRLNQTQIFVNVIDPQTPSQVKFNIFKRINTGGKPLNAQEIRHAMAKERSRRFLNEMVELPEFDSATGGVLKNHWRMVDFEVALRFCAFTLLGETEKYGSSGSMAGFLTGCTEAIDSQLSDDMLAKLKAGFSKAMQNAENLFGTHAFRKWPAGVDRKSPFNRAIFESWAVPLAELEWEQLESSKDKIVAAARESMKPGSEYDEAVSATTNLKSRVKSRFAVVRGILGDL